MDSGMAAVAEGPARAARVAYREEIDTRDRGGVDVAYVHLADGIERLHALLDQLDTRLGPVVRPTPPTPDGGVLTEQARARSSLAENLEERARSIDMALGRLGSLLDRIDL